MARPYTKKEIEEMTGLYYLMKRGYYYRPDAKGYTSYKSEAGEFTYLEMKAHTEGVEGVTSKPV